MPRSKRPGQTGEVAPTQGKARSLLSALTSGMENDVSVKPEGTLKQSINDTSAPVAAKLKVTPNNFLAGGTAHQMQNQLDINRFLTQQGMADKLGLQPKFDEMEVAKQAKMNDLATKQAVDQFSQLAPLKQRQLLDELQARHEDTLKMSKEQNQIALEHRAKTDPLDLIQYKEKALIDQNKSANIAGTNMLASKEIFPDTASQIKYRGDVNPKVFGAVNSTLNANANKQQLADTINQATTPQTISTALDQSNLEGLKTKDSLSNFGVDASQARSMMEQKLLGGATDIKAKSLVPTREGETLIDVNTLKPKFTAPTKMEQLLNTTKVNSVPSSYVSPTTGTVPQVVQPSQEESGPAGIKAPPGYRWIKLPSGTSQLVPL